MRVCACARVCVRVRVCETARRRERNKASGGEKKGKGGGLRGSDYTDPI